MNDQGGRCTRTWLARAGRAAGLAMGLLLGACSEPPQPALAVGLNMRVGADPLVLARERGLVEPGRMKVVELASASEVQRALNNGLLDAAALTLDETLRLVDAGVDLRIVALLNTSLGGDVVVARSDIHSPRELRGESVAVEDSSVGALLLQRMLGQAGLSRAEVRVLNLEVNGHLDALREGRAAAAVSHAPLSATLIAAGYQPIFSSRAIPGEVVDVLVVRAGVLRARPEAVDALLRVWAEGLALVRADPTRAAVALSPGTGLNAIEYVGTLRDVALVPLDESLQRLSEPSGALEARARVVGGALMDVGLLRRMPPLTDLVDTSALKRVLGAPGHP